MSANGGKWWQMVADGGRWLQMVADGRMVADQPADHRRNRPAMNHQRKPSQIKYTDTRSGWTQSTNSSIVQYSLYFLYGTAAYSNQQVEGRVGGVGSDP